MISARIGRQDFETFTGSDVWPDGQFVQLPDPGLENVLAEHVLQDVASASLNVPAGQVEHALF